MNWYIEVLKKYAVFNGRARRKEFWFFVLFNVLVSIILAVVDVLLGTYNEVTGSGLLGLVYALAVFIPYLAVTVRRLHDTNKSGWWLLMPLSTIILAGISAVILIPMFGVAGANETAGGIAAVFLGIIVLASNIVFLIFLVSDSTPGVNRFGNNPKNIMEPVFDIQNPLQQFQQKSTVGSQHNHNVGSFNTSITLVGSGNQTPDIILVPNVEIVVGRSPNVNVKIDNKYVSSKHISLTLIQGKVKVRDLSSSNGTYIDGKKLDPYVEYVLNAGERLLVGSEDVVYSL